MRSLPGRVTVDPATCGGRPFFRGTRIPVYVVLEMLSNQEPISAIIENYPDLTESDLKAAIEYARNLAEIPAFPVAAA